MTRAKTSDDAAIVGVADFVPAKGETIEYWALQSRIATAAIADAGLGRQDIDGVVFTRSGYSQAKPVFPTSFCEHLGITPAWAEIAPHGGAQMASAIWRAATAIRNGMATTVLVMAADNRESRFQRAGVVAAIADQNMDPEFEVPFGPLFITNFALMAQRYLHEYGATEADLAELAVAQRRWAGLHPGARMRTPLTVEDVLTSRMISSPLHLLDICLVTDGGVGLVVTTREAAADLVHEPVYILGFGDQAESQTITCIPDLIGIECYRRAAEHAFRMAGISPADVDIVYPYDPTTFFALFGLEQMGFAEPGGAPELVRSGATSLGGRLPVNTHGGLLSYGHPGAPGALLAVAEAVRQLRGDAGDRQVADACIAVASALGGFMACGVNIFGTEAALS